MTDSDSYPALLQSNTSTLLTPAPSLIFTNCFRKKTWLAAISTAKPTATPTHFLWYNTIVTLQFVDTGSYLHMVIAWSVCEVIVMNAAGNLCWLGKAWVVWLLLRMWERAMRWCGMRGQCSTVRNQIYRHVVHKPYMLCLVHCWKRLVEESEIQSASPGTGTSEIC